MQIRAKEYEALGLDVRWLSQEKAKNAYQYASKFSSSKRYGLNEVTVKGIDHLEIESYAVANEWLKSRIPSTGTVQVVYSESQVCILESGAFLANWQSIFTPARDDAIVLHDLEPTVLFYCHEEELEVGQRIA
jgi:hypothetical protein